MSERLLDSIVANTIPAEREQIEVLIKYDNRRRLPASGKAFFFRRISVRRQGRFTLVAGRGAGNGLHNAQEYLFTQRDPRSRFLLMNRRRLPIHAPPGLRQARSSPSTMNFVILGAEAAANRGLRRALRTGKDDPRLGRVVRRLGRRSSRVGSSRCARTSAGQANVDSWLMGLSVVLYDMYGIVLWEDARAVSTSAAGRAIGRPVCGAAPHLQQHGTDQQQGPREQVLVRNWCGGKRGTFYLNMMHGTSLKPLGLGARRDCCGRFRSQPLSELPGRALRKLVAEFEWVQVI